MKLNFEKPFLIISYCTVSGIVNEKRIYAMINVKETIFNFEETKQSACKNDEMLQLRQAVFKDSTECIPITFFDKNMSKISEANDYPSANVRVCLFQFQKILKTGETIELTEDDNCKYYVTKVESSVSSLKKT